MQELLQDGDERVEAGPRRDAHQVPHVRTRRPNKTHL